MAFPEDAAAAAAAAAAADPRGGHVEAASSSSRAKAEEEVLGFYPFQRSLRSAKAKFPRVAQLNLLVVLPVLLAVLLALWKLAASVRAPPAAAPAAAAAAAAAEPAALQPAAPNPPELGLSLQPESLSSYEQDYLSSAANFSRTWNAASHTVKKAFAANFTPRGQGEEPKGPGSHLYNENVREMQEFMQLPPPESPDRRRAYALHLIALSSAFKGASECLKMLEKMEKIHQETLAPVPLLGIRQGVQLPRAGALEHFQGPLASEKELLETMPGSFEPGEAKKVPQLLLQRVQGLLQLERTQQHGFHAIHEQFKPLLKALGYNSSHLTFVDFQKMESFWFPYPQNIFNTARFFMEYQRRAEQTDEPEKRYQETLYFLSHSWRNAKDLLKAIETMQNSAEKAAAAALRWKCLFAYEIENQQGLINFADPMLLGVFLL